jgi:hypothetical protein
MVGRLPPPPLVRADTHCLQTSPAPSDLHYHCCGAAAFLVAPPLPSLPRHCYLLCPAATAVFLAARPPLPSLPRGCRCLPCRTAAAAFLAAWPPLPYCLPHRAAAKPSQLGTLHPSPWQPFQRVSRHNPPRLPTPMPCCRRRAAAALPPPPMRSTVALPAAAALLPTNCTADALPPPPPRCRRRQCCAAAKLPLLLTFHRFCRRCHCRF